MVLQKRSLPLCLALAQAMPSQLTMVYFPVRARAEASRMLMAYGGECFVRAPSNRPCHPWLDYTRASFLRGIIVP